MKLMIVVSVTWYFLVETLGADPEYCGAVDCAKKESVDLCPDRCTCTSHADCGTSRECVYPGYCKDCADEGDWCYMDNLSGIKSSCCKEGLVCDKMNMKNGYAHCIKKEPGCSCTSKIYGGRYGRCIWDYKGGRICYISPKATCSDREFSRSANSYYSWIACYE